MATAQSSVGSSGQFNIDSSSGQLQTSEILDRGKYILNITASDNGSPNVLSSNAVVVVHVVGKQFLC